MRGRRGLDTAALQHRLMIRRDELDAEGVLREEHRRRTEVDETAAGPLSRLDALQDQAIAEEAERRRVVELHRVEAALQRLAGGEYGYCAGCGEAIAAKRLELDPAAPTCIACAGGACAGGRR